jgi:Tol biopolymer transport system component
VNFLSPAVSVDEKRLYALGTQPRGELMRYDRAAGNFVPYLAGLSVEGLDFSRDGEWLTYVTYPEGVLWRSRVDGSQPLQLTDASMWAGLPRWSPDAKRIAFTASRSGGLRKIYVVSAEGGGAEEIIPGEGAQFDPSWSPDGNSLAFGEDFWKFDGVIRIIDLKTRQISVIPGSEGLFSPRWSTDGRFLLALGHILQNSQKLMMYDFATRKWQQLAEGKSIDYPVWSRNRDYVYFSSLLDNGTPNRRVRISDRKVEQITEVNLPRGLTSGQFGSWTGLAPDDSPLLLRDTSIQEIYALDVELP